MERNVAFYEAWEIKKCMHVKRKFNAYISSAGVILLPLVWGRRPPSDDAKQNSSWGSKSHFLSLYMEGKNCYYQRKNDKDTHACSARYWKKEGEIDTRYDVILLLLLLLYWNQIRHMVIGWIQSESCMGESVGIFGLMGPTLLNIYVHPNCNWLCWQHCQQRLVPLRVGNGVTLRTGGNEWNTLY